MNKEIEEYEKFAAFVNSITSDFKQTGENLRYLFESNFAKNDTIYTDEDLRKLIKITRSIRETIFSSLDTHILTIEHLADKKLCQRHARERAAKDTTTQVNTKTREFNKPVVKSGLDRLMELMNKATPEQLQQALNNAKKNK